MMLIVRRRASSIDFLLCLTCAYNPPINIMFTKKLTIQIVNGSDDPFAEQQFRGRNCYEWKLNVFVLEM